MKDVYEIQTWIDKFGEDQLNLDNLKDYLEFVKSAENSRDHERYSEWHHVMPKCLDEEEEYVKYAHLNGADHFRAHMKLVECFNGTAKFKLSSSLFRMSPKCLDGVSAEEYEKGKSYFIENMAKFREYDYSGENNPFYGKHHTDEAKERNRVSHLKENMSEETLRKMSENHRDVSGNNNPMKNSEARLKLSLSMKGKKKTQEHKDHLSQSLKGKFTGNLHPMYGKKHRKDSIEKMVKLKTGSNNPNFGKISITNGSDNRFVDPKDPLPDGWWRGRSRKSR